MSDRDADDAAAAARAFLSTISMDAPAPVLTRPQRSPSAPDTTAVPRSLPPHATTAAVHPPARLQRPRSPSAPDAHAGARSFLTSIELSPERGPAPCPLPTAAPAPAASALGGTHVRRPPSAGLASCLPHRHAHGHNHGHGHSASRFLLFGAVRRTQSSHEPPTALPAGTPPTTQDQGLYQQQQQQQQQGQHALCGYAGVAEVCSQSRRRQRHVRLVFASGAACPLIAASYRLDRRVHISDFGPYDVQLPAHGHRGRRAPRTPALPHLRAGLPPWLRADSPDASLTVSDTASSSALSDSPQTPRRSYAACLAPRWVGHAAVESAVLDPWDEHEHHATVVALTGLRASVVPYLGARAARDEADARFLREHPGLRDTGLRVTKLRKRKMSLLQITVSTVCDRHHNHFLPSASLTHHVHGETESGRVHRSTRPVSRRRCCAAGASPGRHDGARLCLLLPACRQVQ